VLCEKPLALSIEDTDAMIAAAAETGRTPAVNHHLRASATRVGSAIVSTSRAERSRRVATVVDDASIPSERDSVALVERAEALTDDAAEVHEQDSPSSAVMRP
jgi:hypothetical protein